MTGKNSHIFLVLRTGLEPLVMESIGFGAVPIEPPPEMPSGKPQWLQESVNSGPHPILAGNRLLGLLVSAPLTSALTSYEHHLS